MWEDEVDMRLPELIPDWVLTNWPEPLEPGLQLPALGARAGGANSGGP